jgi:hypothetical protein
MKLIKNIKKHFKKHQFDLDNPEIVHINLKDIGLSTTDNLRTFSIFKCINCDAELYLDREDMDNLPRQMSHGCPGKE